MLVIVQNGDVTNKNDVEIVQFYLPHMLAPPTSSHFHCSHLSNILKFGP